MLVPSIGVWVLSGCDENLPASLVTQEVTLTWLGEVKPIDETVVMLISRAGRAGRSPSFIKVLVTCLYAILLGRQPWQPHHVCSWDEAHGALLYPLKCVP
ncbi:hypothetical protein EON65_18550 [archaeon]|nr:MAG: hypothetical protein EON65_18550 [archaeon]